MPAVCIIMLQACNSRSTSADNAIPVITVDPNAEGCIPDEIFDSYTYTILETNDSILLPMITRMDIDDKHILITSRTEVFVFNRDGSFLAKFDVYGQGPGELTRIYDAKLIDDEIVMIGHGYKGIYRYSFQGDIIGEYPLDFEYYFMNTDNENIWLASENSNFSMKNFAKYSLNDREITCQLMDFEKNESYIGLFTPFLFRNGNNLFVTKQFDNSVYMIDYKNCTITEAWRYDFKTEMKLSDFTPGTSFYELEEKTRNNDIVTNLGLLYINGDIVYQTFLLFDEYSYSHSIYRFDMANPSKPGKLLIIHKKKSENLPYICTGPSMIYNGNHISVINAESVLTIDEKNGSTRFKDLGLTEDSNPVIFFHHFK